MEDFGFLGQEMFNEGGSNSQEKSSIRVVVSVVSLLTSPVNTPSHPLQPMWGTSRIWLNKNCNLIGQLAIDLRQTCLSSGKW